MTWQAIWSDGRIARKAPSVCTDPLRAMTLWLELIGPRRPLSALGRRLRGAKPLRLWQGARDAARPAAVTLYLMPDGALRLVQGEVDLCTAPDTLRAGETVSVRYVACSMGREDVFEVINHERATTQRLRSGLAVLATLADALPRAPGFLSVAHVVAVADAAMPGSDLPGIESGAMVATPGGPRRVETLVAGEEVLDHGGRAHPLRWIEARPRLCLGRSAPICLSAPYFGLTRNLVVTPQTRLLQRGPIVDYLCGTEAVLASAADLATGRAVMRDRTRAVRLFHHMMLDDPACLMVENSPIETAHLGDVIASGRHGISQWAAPRPSDLEPSLPLLDRATARALVTAHARAA